MKTYTILDEVMDKMQFIKLNSPLKENKKPTKRKPTQTKAKPIKKKRKLIKEDERENYEVSNKIFRLISILLKHMDNIKIINGEDIFKNIKEPDIFKCNNISDISNYKTKKKNEFNLLIKMVYSIIYDKDEQMIVLKLPKHSYEWINNIKNNYFELLKKHGKNLEIMYGGSGSSSSSNNSNDNNKGKSASFDLDTITHEDISRRESYYKNNPIKMAQYVRFMLHFIY